MPVTLRLNICWLLRRLFLDREELSWFYLFVLSSRSTVFLFG